MLEALVNALENGVAEFDFVVFDHSSRKDGAFSDEVRNKSVCRFVVHFFRGCDLLDFAHTHDHDFIGHSERFFLVVCDVDEGYAETFVHIHEFELHVFSHFKVECAERLVEEQHFGFVYERASDCNSLLLTAAK